MGTPATTADRRHHDDAATGGQPEASRRGRPTTPFRRRRQPRNHRAERVHVVRPVHSDRSATTGLPRAEPRSGTRGRRGDRVIGHDSSGRILRRVRGRARSSERACGPVAVRDNACWGPVRVTGPRAVSVLATAVSRTSAASAVVDDRSGSTSTVNVRTVAATGAGAGSNAAAARCAACAGTVRKESVRGREVWSTRLATPSVGCTVTGAALPASSA